MGRAFPAVVTRGTHRDPPGVLEPGNTPTRNRYTWSIVRSGNWETVYAAANRYWIRITRYRIRRFLAGRSESEGNSDSRRPIVRWQIRPPREQPGHRHSRG